MATVALIVVDVVVIVAAVVVEEIVLIALKNMNRIIAAVVEGEVLLQGENKEKRMDTRKSLRTKHHYLINTQLFSTHYQVRYSTKAPFLSLHKQLSLVAADLAVKQQAETPCCLSLQVVEGSLVSLNKLTLLGEVICRFKNVPDNCQRTDTTTQPHSQTVQDKPVLCLLVPNQTGNNIHINKQRVGSDKELLFSAFMA